MGSSHTDFFPLCLSSYSRRGDFSMKPELADQSPITNVEAKASSQKCISIQNISIGRKKASLEG